MATTCYFEEHMKDQERNHTVFLEFGRSSFYPDDSIYVTTSEGTVILTREKARELCEAMASLAAYHGLDK